MKPKNFPDRKNKRRLVALSHLSTPKYKKEHGDDKKRFSSETEEQALQARIVPQGLRHVRTKVNRSGRGKIGF